MGSGLLLIAATLSAAPAANSGSSTATATIRVYHSVKLNRASELSEANAHLRRVPAVVEGAIQYIPVAEFE
jgi:hypothetical protein